MSINAPAYVEPVLKTIEVRCAREHAFKVFTACVDRWWKRDFSVNPTRAAIAEVVLEPRAGGRWFERGADGSECDWGHVMLWDPPARLVVAWKVTAEGKYQAEPHTEVEVAFAEVSTGVTRVTLEHRRLEALGAAAEVARTRINGGWGALLELFAAEAA
jgi:hypothetical protein